jgi:hypothetical protein
VTAEAADKQSPVQKVLLMVGLREDGAGGVG